MMKKEELKKILEEKNIPEYLYNFNENGQKDERFCMENVGGKWRVYFLERGIMTTNEIFDSEDEACQFVYEQLLD